MDLVAVSNGRDDPLVFFSEGADPPASRLGPNGQVGVDHRLSNLVIGRRSVFRQPIENGSVMVGERVVELRCGLL